MYYFNTFLYSTQYEKKYAEHFGNEDIRIIKTYDIKKFKNSLPIENSPRTQKNILKALQKFFQDHYEDDFISDMPRFSRIRTQEPEYKWIDENTQQEILEHIPDCDKPFFQFLCTSGLRPAEIRALKWKNIKPDHIQIQASFSNGVYREITKTKNQWAIPLLDSIREVLSRVPRGLPEAFVFWYGNGKPYGEKKYRQIWHDACDKAKVREINVYQGTRHSFASQHVNKGKSLEMIGSMMGHTTTQTTKKYAHLDKLKALREAFEK